MVSRHVYAEVPHESSTSSPNGVTAGSPNCGPCGSGARATSRPSPLPECRRWIVALRMTTRCGRAPRDDPLAERDPDRLTDPKRSRATADARSCRDDEVPALGGSPLCVTLFGARLTVRGTLHEGMRRPLTRVSRPRARADAPPIDRRHASQWPEATCAQPRGERQLGGAPRSVPAWHGVPDASVAGFGAPRSGSDRRPTTPS